MTLAAQEDDEVMLLDKDGAFDRAAIMRDAHRQYRQMRRFGWSWSRCLSFAWSKAKAMRLREAMVLRMAA